MKRLFIPLLLLSLAAIGCGFTADAMLAASEGYQASKDKQAKLEIFAAQMGAEYAQILADIEEAKAKVEALRQSGASVESVALASQEVARLAGRAVEIKASVDQAIEIGKEEVAAWRERYEAAKAGEGDGGLPPWLDMLIYGVASLAGVGGVWQSFKKNSALAALGKVATTNVNGLSPSALADLKKTNAAIMSKSEKKALKIGLSRV